MSATVVLVHGAWHGAWCWDRVVPLLEDAGVRAIAVDLPGHGSDPGPLADLHGDAARVGEVLDGLGRDAEVVLLGHSYGGAVITEAGVHPSVRHLVYLCAFALDDGESCMTVFADSSAPEISWEGRPNLADAFVYDGETVSIDPARAAAFFYNDCDDETAAWAAGQLGPQPLSGLGQAPADVGRRSRPSTYVVCTDDMAVHPDLQRILAARCDETVEWPVSHSPFLSRPELVAGLLVDLAG